MFQVRGIVNVKPLGIGVSLVCYKKSNNVIVVIAVGYKMDLEIPLRLFRLGEFVSILNASKSHWKIWERRVI